MHVREASYAVGKTKIATTRRVLLPAARPSVITGAMLGVGRVIGDTAIIVVLLGATQNLDGVGSTPAARHAPGDGQHPDELHLRQRSDRRAQPAAQGVRGRVRAADHRARDQRRRRHLLGGGANGGSGGAEKPPSRPTPVTTARASSRPAAPVRACTPLGPRRHGTRDGAATAHGAADPGFVAAAAPRNSGVVRARPDADRPGVGLLRRQAGGQLGVAADPPGRGARPDRSVGVRQDDAAALAQPAHRAQQRA